MAISPPRAGAAGPGGDPSKATHDKQVRIESEVRATAVYGHAVWLAHNDGTITIRKVRTTETVATIAASPQRGRPWALLSVEVPGARPAMWIGYSTGDILVLDIETRHEIKLVCRHTGGVYCLSEFGGMVFSGSNDFEIVQWRARDVSFVRQLNGHTNYVRALHAEGKVLISASDDHTVRVWNATNGQLISIGRFHRCGVGAMCRVGDSMWTGDDEGNIVAWRLQTLEQQELLKEHTARITGLKKIGSRVYSGSADHTIGVWEANSRTLVARIDEHRGWVTNVFSPAHLTRYYVWTAAADQTIRCWHHDEYRSCTKDVERFDDLQWYQIEYNPYRELNDELSTQVSRLETQCAHLLEAYSTDHSHIENCTTQVNIMRGTTAEAEAEAERCRLEAREARQRIEGLVETNARKEKELVQLTEATKASRSENVDLRCANERLKAENAELRRQYELCVSQRDKLDLALKETLTLRAAKGEAIPFIVTTAGETADALIKAQNELRESLQLNETLREDVNRLSRILTASATTNMASSASDNRLHSPRDAKRGAAHGGRDFHGLTTVTIARPPSAKPSRPSTANVGAAAEHGSGESASQIVGGASLRRQSAADATHRQFARGYVMERYLRDNSKR
jgi:hypothetical protein